jgi:hypothetical protein
MFCPEQPSSLHVLSLLHHIYASRINNDDIHQGLETIFGDKNIHLSLDVAREKVGDSF